MNPLNWYWLRKRFWLPKGYRLKLFLTFLGVLVICGGGLILLFGQAQKQSLLKQTYNKGRFVTSILARNLEGPLFFSNREQIRANIEAILRANDIAAVLIYDKDGHLFFSHITPLFGKDALRPEELSRFASFMAEHADGDEEIPRSHWRQDRYFVFCKEIFTIKPAKDKDSLYFDTGKTEQSAVVPLGGVQVVFSRIRYEQGMEQIIRHALLIFLLFLPSSLFMAFNLARDVVKPLRTLVDTLRTRLGTSDDDGDKKNDELGELDIRLKQLVGRLDHSFATITQLNEGLENKVAERTEDLIRAMHELKETQAQLVQSGKMGAVGQLVAGVAHEINNTTNFVTGALPPLTKRLAELRRIVTEHGEQGCPDSIRIEELMQNIDLLLGNIREGARRTGKIVNDLKNFSRPDDDLTSRVDINQCLESTLALALPEYRHRIEVFREFAPDLPKITGSQGQLCQVFMNLIINAIHAQPKKGTLRIRTFSHEDEVHVIFADNGPGIPKDIQKMIFEPFFTTKEIGKGTGLGLSVSYGIITKHRGSIVVRSEPGHGAEFEVILPAGEKSMHLPVKEDEA